MYKILIAVSFLFIVVIIIHIARYNIRHSLLYIISIFQPVAVGLTKLLLLFYISTHYFYLYWSSVNIIELQYKNPLYLFSTPFLHLPLFTIALPHKHFLPFLFLLILHSEDSVLVRFRAYTMKGFLLLMLQDAASLDNILLWCSSPFFLLQCITYPYQTSIAAIVHDFKHLPIKNTAPLQKILET